jgi:polyisoprenyl-teichoic acid--peptidoglycan teichoic acid transferase
MRRRTRPFQRRRSASRFRRFVWSAAGTGICLGGITAGALWSIHGSPLAALPAVGKPFSGKRRANVLVLGLDDGQGGQGRSDSMLLVHVDTEPGRLSALSIPRDTRISLDGGRFCKINAAHARGGAQMAARAVHELTGLPVDYTLSTNFAGFSHLVDLLGGIDLNVEQPMDYDDHWGHLSIHLKPGQQHLDGERAIQYVRFRKGSPQSATGDGSDISRIGRQQKFLQAVAARCLTGSNLIHLPELIREGRQQVHTDLATADLFYIAALAKEIGPAGLKVLTIPGTTAMVGGQSYWLPATAQMAQVAAQFEGGGPTAAVPVDVAVLNASARHGLGRRVADRLTEHGYRVRSVATGAAPEEGSRVIAPAGALSEARAIATMLACDCATAAPAASPPAGAPITVVIGRDYAGREELSRRG